MKIWMLLVIMYGIINGFNNIFKKKALEKNTTLEVLLIHFSMSFLLISYNFMNVLTIQINEIIIIFIKTLFVFLATLCSFKSISKLSISFYGVISMSSILFSTLLGTIFLKDRLSAFQIVGMIIIAIGLLLSNLIIKDKKKNEKKYIILLFLACLLNSLSSMFDKIITKTVSALELQWWFMLFLMLLYWIYILINRKNIEYKKVLKNKWVYLLSIGLIISDKLLFSANTYEDSQLTLIILLKQISPVITIVIGGKIFKEKKIGYKLFFALMIIIGILLLMI